MIAMYRIGHGLLIILQRLHLDIQKELINYCCHQHSLVHCDILPVRNLPACMFKVCNCIHKRQLCQCFLWSWETTLKWMVDEHSVRLHVIAIDNVIAAVQGLYVSGIAHNLVRYTGHKAIKCPFQAWLGLYIGRQQPTSAVANIPPRARQIRPPFGKAKDHWVSLSRQSHWVSDSNRGPPDSYPGRRSPDSYPGLRRPNHKQVAASSTEDYPEENFLKPAAVGWRLWTLNLIDMKPIHVCTCIYRLVCIWHI